MLRSSIWVFCALVLLGCSALPPSPTQVAEEDQQTELNKRQEESAIRALRELKSRKRKARLFAKAPKEKPWEDEIRQTHIERTVAREQRTVDRMPTAILRPKAKDPELLEDATPEFEAKPALEDSEHAALIFYRQGLKHVDNRQWDAALSAFSRFLEMAPEHIYSDRAAYWISHCHYLAGDHGLAIVTSNQFESRYPHSQRLPEMIYYRALSHLELGQYEEAVPELRSLLEKFPSNNLAGSASRKLAEIQVQKEVVTP